MTCIKQLILLSLKKYYTLGAEKDSLGLNIWLAACPLSATPYKVHPGELKISWTEPFYDYLQAADSFANRKVRLLTTQ